MICKICDIDITSPALEACEMMFGFKTQHTYYECSNCEALQIEKIPEQLDQYYPESYYSFKQRPGADIDSTFLRKIKSAYYLYDLNMISGFLLSIGYNVPDYMQWLKITGTKFDDPILDVGSGNGDILTRLCGAGFANLQGIDPFLKEEFISANGNLKLLRRSVFEKQENETYALVMLNHSFEHMDDPQVIFRRLASLVAPGKMLLIRTPVNKSFASKKYGINWVDMDPPRHLVIHSVKSIQSLADKNGFSLELVIYDSTAFQFWGSEQYIKGISLHDPQSYAVNKETTLFTKLQINEWKRQAEELNEKGDGDQACYYLRRN